MDLVIALTEVDVKKGDGKGVDQEVDQDEKRAIFLAESARVKAGEVFETGVGENDEDDQEVGKVEDEKHGRNSRLVLHYSVQ